MFQMLGVSNDNGNTNMHAKWLTSQKGFKCTFSFSGSAGKKRWTGIQGSKQRILSKREDNLSSWVFVEDTKVMDDQKCSDNSSSKPHGNGGKKWFKCYYYYYFIIEKTSAM